MPACRCRLILGPPFRSGCHQQAILQLHLRGRLPRRAGDEELEGGIPEEGDVHHDVLGDHLPIASLKIHENTEIGEEPQLMKKNASAIRDLMIYRDIM